MTKNTNKNYKELITAKKAMMEVIDKVMDELESYERYYLCESIKTNEYQAKDFDGNLLYRDANGKRTTEVTDTPIMDYDLEYRLPADMDDFTRARVDALEKVRECLSELI